MRDAGLLQIAEEADINAPGDAEQIFIYVDASDGKLKSKQSDGTVTTATADGNDVVIFVP